MTNPIAKDLGEVARLLEKATSGEWRWSINGNIVPEPYTDTEIAAVYSEHDDDTMPANAAAIIAAVQFLRTHSEEIAGALACAREYDELIRHMDAGGDFYDFQCKRTSMQQGGGGE